MSTATLTQWTERDDYGRTVRIFAVNGRAVAARISIPTQTRHLLGYSYMVADWADPMGADGKPKDSSKHLTTTTANAAAEAIQNREATK